MHFDILTLFPEMFHGPFSESLIKKAQEKGLLSINLVNPRDYASDKHQITDDSPYGGGPGMVMKIEPIKNAIQSVHPTKNTRVVLLSPDGGTFNQEKAKEFSGIGHIILICGHYEGFDERIRETLITDEISIGDYVLTGGEIPAMVFVDCVARLFPGVVKERDSIINESFFDGLLDYPSYTKPEDFEGLAVPKVLLSGNHKEINEWRRKEALKRTFFRRPDLLAKTNLSPLDQKFIEEIILNG